ncbi:MAG: rhodanese-like domain-containing protein [Thiohalomonadales bacterium]
MKTFTQLVSDSLPLIEELFPWDLEGELAGDSKPLLIDVREPEEYFAMHISGSILVPRGILESACDYGYPETVPRLADSRTENVVLICRSGNRSALAALTLNIMGFQQVRSLKTGVRGWNESEQPLVNQRGESVDSDMAEDFLSPKISSDKQAK